MYYPRSDNKGADHLRSHLKLICAFVIPRHLKKCGVLCYTLQNIFAFECSSVRLSVRQRIVSGLYLEHLLTDFVHILYETISGRSGLGLKMGKFCQISTDLWPLVYAKISFPGSILSIY